MLIGGGGGGGGVYKPQDQKVSYQGRKSIVPEAEIHRTML